MSLGRCPLCGYYPVARSAVDCPKCHNREFTQSRGRKVVTIRCDTCRGSGRIAVREQKQTPLGNVDGQVKYWIDCYHCESSGSITFERDDVYDVRD